MFEKLEVFTNYKVKFRYFWKTRKVRYLAGMNKPVNQKANIIY